VRQLAVLLTLCAIGGVADVASARTIRTDRFGVSRLGDWNVRASPSFGAYVRSVAAVNASWSTTG
jgi:hypothetical protein